MTFTDWLDEIMRKTGDRLGYLICFVVFLLIFVIIPGLLYILVKVSPATSGSPTNPQSGIGISIFFFLYYLGIYYFDKWQQTRKRLIKLLDKLLDENELDNIVAIAKDPKVKFYNQERQPDKKEDRDVWFIDY